MARRHYSDADRASALAILDSLSSGDEKRVSRAAQQAGVPRTTLVRWLEDRDNAAPAELRQEKRIELADLFENESRAALGEADKKRPRATYKELIVGAAVSADKVQLLRGGATQRVEGTVKVTIDLGEPS